MSQPALRLVEGSSMDKSKALSAALSQIERQFGRVRRGLGPCVVKDEGPAAGQGLVDTGGFHVGLATTEGS